MCSPRVGDIGDQSGLEEQMKQKRANYGGYPVTRQEANMKDENLTSEQEKTLRSNMPVGGIGPRYSSSVTARKKKRKKTQEPGPTTFLSPANHASPNVPSNAPAHSLDAFRMGQNDALGADMVHTGSVQLRTIAKKRRITPNWVSQKDSNKGITEGGEIATSEDQDIYHTGIRSKRQTTNVQGA